MKRLVAVSLFLIACGDNNPGTGVDARIDAPATIDGPSVDAPDIDAPDIDAPTGTPAELMDAVRGAADGTMNLPLEDVTITYIKPAITGATAMNDPAGFTVQLGATGPAVMIEADVTMLTPTPAVGDVVSFTIGEIDIVGMGVRGKTITNYSRTTAATDIGPLVQDVTATANLAALVGDYDSEIVDATVTIAEVHGNSGAAFNRWRVTTTGVPTLDTNLQLRVPQTLRESLNLEVGCVLDLNRVPVNRFNAQFQISAFVAADITVVSCPAPTVTLAAATDSTHVTLTFSKAIDAATVLANGSQFTIVDDATTPNPLAVSAAAPGTLPTQVVLTTAAQTAATNYTVTVANTVKDTRGTGIGTPNTAAFSGYTVVAPTVMMATASNATTVKVTFTRALDVTSVLAAGTQFTIVDGTSTALNVTAATATGMEVTLTTDTQTSGTMYTVTVANTVLGMDSTPLAAPFTAMFAGFTASTPANHLVISEIDYDNVGTDTAEFIEILNPTGAAISLAGKRVVLVNGDNSANPAIAAANGSIDLSPLGTLDAGQYLVIGSSTLIATMPATVKTLAFAGPMDQVQNGPRDGVFLVDVGNAGMSILPTIIDSVVYEGNTTGNYTYDAAGQSLVLVPEGTSSTAADSHTVAGSLCRMPNGVDTNDNSVDIVFCTMVTAGAANAL